MVESVSSGRGMGNKPGCLRAALLASFLLANLAGFAASGGGYAGSKVCKTCHQKIYEAWTASDHYRSMAEATERTVLGDFDGEPLQFHGIRSRYFKKDDHKGHGRFYIETDRGKGAETFEVKYVFGHSPLQQYLVELDNGHIQALNIAWDARPGEKGGGRWMHLQPGEAIDFESPFFWTAHFQNWNGQCADCHSTGVSVNYDQPNHRFDSTFAEINVACEACHGPGRAHVNAGGGGPIHNAPRELAWRFEEGDPIAKPSGGRNGGGNGGRNGATAGDAMINMCGGCHSRRSVAAKTETGTETRAETATGYHDQYRIALLEEGLYHADGQIQDEVFVLGSFLQSRMIAKGVTCANCHEPHSGKLLFEGNGLCAQCHDPAVFDGKPHHFHAMETPARPLCVDCHMPQKTYMRVDERADHRFGSPHLDPGSDLPSACLNCHQEMPTVEGRGGDASAITYASVNARLRQGDPLVFRDAMKLLASESLPEIQRATIISGLTGAMPVKSLERQARHGNPMVRRAAALALAGVPFPQGYPLLRQLAEDSVSTVRHAAAQALSRHFRHIKPGEMAFFTRLIDEYRASLELGIHSPGTLAQLASLEASLGRWRKAEEAYLRALSVEPNYLPAMLNYADLKRASGDEETAASVLSKAVAFAPDSAAANFSYALSLVRQQKTTQALPYFLAATRQADATPRYAYAYAVALDSQGRVADALDALRKAKTAWPNQYDLLWLESLLMEKSGDTAGIAEVLRQLLRLDPGRPESAAARDRLRRYEKSSYEKEG